MKTLTIKDLSRTAELDRAAMTGISGGMYKGWMPAYSMTSIDKSSDSFSFDAKQSIGQEQNTIVNTGNNAAFVSDITSTVKPKQTADNTINFG